MPEECPVADICSISDLLNGDLIILLFERQSNERIFQWFFSAANAAVYLFHTFMKVKYPSIDNLCELWHIVRHNCGEMDLIGSAEQHERDIINSIYAHFWVGAGKTEIHSLVYSTLGCAAGLSV